MRASSRWDAFDGLRTILVSGVMAHHMEWVLGHADPVAEAGWLPVDGFFVLSGFLIATNLLRELDGTGSIRVGRFLARRLARLYPALLVALAAIGVVSVAADRHSFADTWPSLVSSAAYGHNFSYLYGWFDPLLFEVGPLWSLSVEFQFYLALPLVLLALATLRVPRSWWVVVFVAIAVASATWRAILGFDGYPDSYLFTPVRLDSLMWGVLLAIGWAAGGRLPPAVARVAAVAGAAVLVGLYVTASAYENATYLWAITAAGLASAAVVVWLLQEPASLASRALSWPPLVALGRRSYSAYLWHQAVFLFLADHTSADGWSLVVAGFAVTWVLSDLTYRLVERPALEWSRARTAPAIV